ncbi:MAG: hypothetical protein R3E66_12945 [bacterium]
MNTLKFESVERVLTQSRSRLETLQKQTKDRALTLVRDLEKNGVRVREHSIDALFDARDQAIHTVADVAQRIPALEAQATKLREEAARLEATRRTRTDLAIPGYDTLGVKDIVPALDALTKDQLLTVLAHEEANKARKTVLSSIERALNKLA